MSIQSKRMGLFADLRFSLRLFRRTPALTAIALVSIALSTGATAVVFTAIKAVLIDPLPYHRPSELVQIGTDYRNVAQSQGDWIFWNDASEIIRRTRTLASTGIYGNAVFDLAGDPSTPPEALYGIRVSASLFPTLGVSPVLGRGILPEDDRPGAPHIIVLSHGLWTRRYHNDPQVIGRTAKINGEDYVITGVMDAAFNFPLRRGATRVPHPYVEFYAPLRIDPAHPAGGGMGLVARLKPGITLEQAQADLASISSALAREFPSTNRDRTHRIAYLRQRTLRSAEPALWMLMAAAVLFLLIGCANVAHLLLARGLARAREITVRMAIGAPASRIIRQLLTESCLLALAGGLAGFVLTIAAWQILPVIVPVSIPRLSAARADASVFVFALIVAVLNGILFGIAPALRAAARPLAHTQLRMRTGDASRRDRLRSVLITAEVAVTVMLVIVGGQLGGSFLSLLETNPGFDADRVLASIVLPARERYPQSAGRAAVYRKFLDAVTVLPGVERAGTVDALPFSGENTGGNVTTDPAAIQRPSTQLVAEVNVAGGNYLQALGVRLIAGRWFQPEEMDPSNASAIVDEVAARVLWPQGNPIGQRLCVHCSPEHPDNWKRVVGVVSTLRHASLQGPAHANVFLSAGALERAAFLIVRTARPAAEMEKAIRAAIASIDPDQPVLLFASMQSFIDDSIADRRFILTLLLITACLAMLMSAAGVYGVTAFATSRRTQEIGIRMALGATPRGIHALIFGQGFRHAALGVGIGLLCAAAAIQALRGLLPGLEVRNLSFIVLATALVISSAAIACWFPARRATRIDPMSALRYEP